MGTWPVILFAQLMLATVEEPSSTVATGQTIVFFTRPEKRVLDESLLLDAVAIYTRDLGLGLLRAAEPPPVSLTPTTTDEVVAVLRARGGRLGFWTQGGADGHSVELVVVDLRKLVVRQTFAYEVAGADLYRALALKLRVVAVGGDVSAPLATGLPAPPVGTGGAPTGPGTGVGGAPLAAVPGGRVGAPSGGSAEARATGASLGAQAQAPARGGPPHRFQVAAGYALSVPSGSASWRQAAALHGIARFRSYGEGDVGIEIARADEKGSATGSLAVLDLPLRFGARVASRGPAHFVGIGVTAGAHLLYARAMDLSPSNGVDRTWALAASAGLEFVLRTASVYGVAPEFRLWVEANAPRTRFLVRGVSGFEAGAGNAGFSAGLAFPSP